MRAPDHIAKPSSGLLLLAAVAVLSLWPPLLSIAEEGTPLADVLAEGDEVTDDSTGAVADSAVADGNTVDGDGAGGDDEAALTSEVVPPDEGFIERSARAFTESDLVFVRGLSNAPFLPVAFLGNTYYGDAMVSEEGATPETAGTRYSVNSTSQYAGVPFLLNKRSMVVLGEYVSYSNFTVENGEDFSVASASLAAGYLYQISDDWQVIGALVPFYNHSSLGERGKDYWQVMAAPWRGTPATIVCGGCLAWVLMTPILAPPGCLTWAPRSFLTSAGV